MKKTPKRRKGDMGEAIAAKYLINRGFLVIDTNYLRPWGEIDIIARRGNNWHFVEVKTVSRGKGGGDGQLRPEENMHEKKIRRLNRAIQTYMLEKKLPQTINWQIDLACVYLDFSTRRARVEMLENVIS